MNAHANSFHMLNNKFKIKALYTQIIFYFILITLQSLMTQAQVFKNTSEVVKLKDVKIQGEANTDALLLNNRSRINLDERITIRTSFKDHLLEYLPDYFDGSTLPNLNKQK